jgi:hypothetical protein
VPSEAIGGLRAWAKSRLGEQEEQLRTLERAASRLREVEDERSMLLGDVGVAVGRLDELGVGIDQVAEFLGGEVSWLRPAAKQARSARSVGSAGEGGS